MGRWWLIEVWHPETPERILVWRNWWRKMLYPKDFATLGEVLADYRIDRGKTP